MQRRRGGRDVDVDDEDDDDDEDEMRDAGEKRGDTTAEISLGGCSRKMAADTCWRLRRNLSAATRAPLFTLIVVAARRPLSQM